MLSHELIDQRSLAFGKAIAEKLRSNPNLVERARDNIQRRLQTCSPRTTSTLMEWDEVIQGPLEGVIALLTSEDQRAVRLRQSNPFAGVLSESERNAILLEFQAYEAKRA